MRKFILALGLIGVLGFGAFRVIQNQEAPIVAVAEGEEQEEQEVQAEARVIIEKVQHGTIEADIEEGNIGDICTLDIKAELLYIIKSVTVNDVALIEDENISGLYKFALVEGDNIVKVDIVVNEEILGALSNIYNEARNKDWSNLFTLENLITIIKWVFDCGILLAIIRYFVRDKKLASKVEKATKDTIEKIIPEATQATVIETVQKVLAPMFTQLQANNVELMKAMSIFAKCMALGQENTPESRIAILEELGKLQISDEATLQSVKAYIEKLFADNLKAYQDTLAQIQAISDANKAIVEEEPETKIDDDGTSI